MAAKPSRKVTSDNLQTLGVERLAEIMAEVADSRPDLKRRLRMELAAHQGPGPLVAEIDRRLSAFETSRGRVGWRTKPAFLRDTGSLAALIAERLAPLDQGAAIERLWRFLDTAAQVGSRLRERDDVNAVYGRAAAALGKLAAPLPAPQLAHDLVEAIARFPSGWAAWIGEMLTQLPAETASAALTLVLARDPSGPGWLTITRRLADAAGDVQAFADTYPKEAASTPGVAAEIGRRFLARGQVAEAGAALEKAAPTRRAWSLKPPEPDFDWETVWIDYLERSGQAEAAQAARWASFERTLSIERARDHIRRLEDFDGVEAETRAFQLAAGHPDFGLGLNFLMAWPALGEARRMIEARPDDIELDYGDAELWAARLRARFPNAAHLLLRRAAALAFRRRDYKASERLTQEADSVVLP